MTFQQVMKNRRKELGLTLKEIGARLGVTEATVQRWESGNIKSLRQGRISQLAEVLEIAPAELMGWENTNSPEKPADVSACDAETNVIRIAGRDGTFVERTLTDDQMDLLKKMMDQLPDAKDL